MTLQLLHVLHFQPKLSLITRTMGAAWDDLAHLFMLFFLVEARYLPLSCCCLCYVWVGGWYWATGSVGGGGVGDCVADKHDCPLRMVCLCLPDGVCVVGARHLRGNCGVIVDV